MSETLVRRLVTLARCRLGKSRYVLKAAPKLAPKEVDCSSFTMWVFSIAAGISLPRLSREQALRGTPVEISEARAGDLIFTRGRQGSTKPSRSQTIGHVGIVTEQGTVIHAANKRRGVVESPMSDFTRSDKFRGIRRILA